MSNLVQGGEQSASGSAEIPFEQALKKLESIVESMEADDLALEQLLTSFEQGMKLIQVCQTKLAEAELKVQQLEKNAAGAMVLKPVSVSTDTPNA
jgi:exodeoxyribonuclease VII small subunit